MTFNRSPMHVNVRYFAAASDAAGASVNTVELPQDSRIRHLRDLLRRQSEGFARLADSLLFAIDDEYVTDDAALSDGAEVACFPPVSGG